jgi:hypothetical protein
MHSVATRQQRAIEERHGNPPGGECVECPFEPGTVIRLDYA